MTPPLIPAWLGEVVACALCGAGLLEQRQLGTGAGVVRCGDCGAPYPVIASVAVLMPEPHVWMAAHRDDLIALLGDDAASLEVAEAFAASAADEPAQPFACDWVPGELAGADWPEPPARFRDTFGRFLDEAGEATPVRSVCQLLGATVGTAIELGIGAGTLTGSLLMRAERLVVADRSLPAVLGVLAREREVLRETPRAGIIADAERLPLRPGAVDVVVAANLIDLLDDPDTFLATAAASLRPGGRIALVTPAPDLGDDAAGDGALDAALRAAGFEAAAGEDWVPWVRAHRAREWQIFFTRVVVATRAEASLH